MRYVRKGKLLPRLKTEYFKEDSDIAISITIETSKGIKLT